VPERFTGVSIAEEMPDVSGRNVWLLRAETAGEEIVNMLTDRGAIVHDIPVYRTEAETIDESGFAELAKGIDVITFTSGSTVRNFKTACDNAGKDMAFLEKTTVACIGPVTAKTARELGFKVDLVAGEHTASSLVDILANHFSEVS
jgi:uroporphyrinogen-III synthase